MKDTTKTSSYDYALPSELIASNPASPPDSAKLLVYERAKDKITHTTFRELFSFLPKNTSIILNDTKVIKARIYGKKSSGGKVEVLLNSPIDAKEFKVYIKGKVRVGTVVDFADDVSLHVKEIFADGMRRVAFFKAQNPLLIDDVYRFLDKYGHVPLPPYIKRDDNKEDEKNYQSLFAKNSGAVAAPTASLHFTPQMLTLLKKSFKHAFVTLHVGAGTFKPIETEDILSHHMHEEFYSLSSEALELIKDKNPLLAVGTTVTRTIEYYVRTQKKQGMCDLFLHPKNPPKRVDFLLTNFHLPRSTLLMLVASFIGLEKTLQIYHEAVEKKYRFFSYGDGMLII